MTAKEEFNRMLNSCEHPRAVYNAMLVLAPLIREARAEQQHTEPLEAIKEGAKKDE